MDRTIAIELTQRQWDLVLWALEEHLNNCNSSPAVTYAQSVQWKIQSQLRMGQE